MSGTIMMSALCRWVAALPPPLLEQSGPMSLNPRHLLIGQADCIAFFGWKLVCHPTGTRNEINIQKPAQMKETTGGSTKEPSIPTNRSIINRIKADDEQG